MQAIIQRSRGRVTDGRATTQARALRAFVLAAVLGGLPAISTTEASAQSITPERALLGRVENLTQGRQAVESQSVPSLKRPITGQRALLGETGVVPGAARATASSPRRRPYPDGKQALLGIRERTEEASSASVSDRRAAQRL